MIADDRKCVTPYQRHRSWLIDWNRLAWFHWLNGSFKNVAQVFIWLLTLEPIFDQSRSRLRQKPISSAKADGPWMTPGAPSNCIRSMAPASHLSQFRTRTGKGNITMTTTATLND